jgi:hypothetical protein
MGELIELYPKEHSEDFSLLFQRGIVGAFSGLNNCVTDSVQVYGLVYQFAFNGPKTFAERVRKTPNLFSGAVELHESALSIFKRIKRHGTLETYSIESLHTAVEDLTGLLARYGRFTEMINRRYESPVLRYPSYRQDGFNVGGNHIGLKKEYLILQTAARLICNEGMTVPVIEIGDLELIASKDLSRGYLYQNRIANLKRVLDAAKVDMDRREVVEL